MLSGRLSRTVRVPLLVLLTACGGCATQDAPRDARAPDGVLPDQSRTPDRTATPADRAITPSDGGSCPASFTPCGGDVVGKWSLVAVCPAGGQSLSKPCSHPYEDLPACTGSGNEAICTNVYGGTITLAADGKSTVEMALHGEMAIGFSDACVVAVTGAASAADGCQSLTTKNGKKLDCTFSNGACRCRFATEPETETKTDVYQVSGTDLVITPSSSGEKIGGSYCVTGDELVMRGVIGWAYWVLRRAP